MSEADFWLSLEFRLVGEFQGLPQRRYRYFSCDGFMPSDYLLDAVSPRITGKAWICDDQRQEVWDFALLLPRRFASREQIDWASLLPPKNMTRWMAFDVHRKYIEIEPAVAVPDLI
jgi:hypothetical protein